MPQHRDREPRIHRLMPARQARQRQFELALRITIMDPPAIGGGVPLPTLHQPACFGGAGRLPDPVGDASGIMEADDRHTGLGDSSLLGGDVLDPIAQERLMIEPELRDAADRRCLDHVGRVEPTAQPHFDDAGIGGRAAEGEEGGGRRHLEEARAEIVGDREHFAQQRREFGILDQLAGNPDPLVEADEVRAGINMRAQPRRFDCGAQIGAGRPLPVGPRDVEHRR